MSRSWRAKFADAGRGVRVAVRGELSLRVHMVVTVAVVVVATVLRCSPGEWALLVGAVGLVLTAELLNTAIELLFKGLPQEERDRVYPCLDVAAGAVLVASGCAVVIGLLVLGPKLLALL